ncbi:MAG: hypothetical protein IPK31_22320 [Chitinophagaceae bacterium]|nr:hypothetical protein [Chitinophagaceae bacterium]
MLLLTAAVAVLFVLHFSGKKSPLKQLKSSRDTASNKPEQLHVAYIDLDTIQKYYEYLNSRMPTSKEINSGLKSNSIGVE